MESWDAIVIGSGIGGMTTAAVLARLGGRRVLVLEKHNRLGGLTHTFRRRGFEWDVGLHYVGGCGEGQGGRKLMDFLTDGAVEWVSMGDPYDVMAFGSPGAEDHLRIELPPGRDALLDRLSAAFPHERAALRDYIADLQLAADWMGLQMYRKSMPDVAYGLSGLFVKDRSELALATVRDVLLARFGDARLRAVLAGQWGDYGLPPSRAAFGLHALVTSSYFDGAWYPRGGSAGIAKGVAALLERHGGTMRARREVTEILVEDGVAVGVRALHHRGQQVEEEEYRAPVIVSNVGAVPTWLRLVPDHVDVPWRDEVRAFPHGPSAVTAFLGLHREPESFGGGSWNLWAYDGWDHDALYDRNAGIVQGEVAATFTSFPSAKDPDATRPTGEILALVDHEPFVPWQNTLDGQRPEAYEAAKVRIGEALVAAVDRHLPGLANAIEVMEVGTPLTYDDFTGHPFGAFYGVPGIPEKFQAEWLEIAAPIRGLYLTGQDVGSLGIFGAGMSGLLAAGRILGPTGFLQVMAPLRG